MCQLEDMYWCEQGHTLVDIGPSTLWAQLFVLPDDYDPTHSAKACSSAQKKGKSQTMHKVDAPPSRAHTLQKLSEPVYL